MESPSAAPSPARGSAAAAQEVVTTPLPAQDDCQRSDMSVLSNAILQHETVSINICNCFESREVGCAEGSERVAANDLGAGWLVPPRTCTRQASSPTSLLGLASPQHPWHAWHGMTIEHV